MRLLDLPFIFFWWMLLLPLLLHGHSIILVLLSLIFTSLTNIVLNQIKLQVGHDTPVLHSLGYSHFVERVRWTLEWLGQDYVERMDAGVFNIFFSGLTVPRLDLPALRTTLGDSTAIVRYFWAAYAGTEKEGKASFLEPTAEVTTLEKEIIEALGGYSRQWMYYHVFQSKSLTLKAWGIDLPTVPQWQRTLLPFLYPLLKFYVSKGLKITESRAARALDKVKTLYDKIDEILDEEKKPFLTGAEPTIADITLASLGALTILPDNYTGGACSKPVFTLEELQTELPSSEYVNEIEAFRKRPTGQLILRMYANYRNQRP
eukprot:m.28400 g.28400  ORF g.28400 m.28400 type:complete len:317 (-) comp9037_c0_seq3:8104-9054(-)